MKKYIIGFLCGAVFFSGVSFAANINATISSIKVFIRNNVANFGTTNPIYTINGVNYAPIKDISEKLGYTYSVKDKNIYLSMSEKISIDTVSPEAAWTPVNYELLLNGNVERDYGLIQYHNVIMIKQGFLEKLINANNISYDKVLQKYTYSTDGLTVSFQTGNRQLSVKSKNVYLNEEPQRIGGYIYLPLESLVKGLGISYNYDSKTKTIIIGNNQPSVPIPTATTPISTQSPNPTATSIPTSLPIQTSTPQADSKVTQIYNENERHRIAIQQIEEDYQKTKNLINGQITQTRRESSVGYYSDSEYDTKVQSCLSDISKVDSKISTLLLDDSFEAKKKRKELQDQLDDLNSQLKKLQDERGAQLRIRGLEDQLKDATERYRLGLSNENNKHQQILNSIH